MFPTLGLGFDMATPLAPFTFIAPVPGFGILATSCPGVGIIVLPPETEDVVPGVGIIEDEGAFTPWAATLGLLLIGPICFATACKRCSNVEKSAYSS